MGWAWSVRLAKESGCFQQLPFLSGCTHIPTWTGFPAFRGAKMLRDVWYVIDFDPDVVVL